MNRRSFMKLGSIFVPVIAAPAVAYSFLIDNKSTAYVSPVKSPSNVHGDLAYILTTPGYICKYMLDWKREWQIV